MKIGLDIDGVLADFHPKFVQTITEVTGRDLWPHPIDWTAFPTEWHFPLVAGYTPSELDQVWKGIWADPEFWSTLSPFLDVPAFLRAINTVQHELYFITDRQGVQAKRQTEDWLLQWVEVPTVLLAGHKSPIVAALGLDVFVDDRWENVSNCPKGIVLDRPYNRGYHGWRRRISNLSEIFR